MTFNLVEDAQKVPIKNSTRKHESKFDDLEELAKVASMKEKIPEFVRIKNSKELSKYITTIAAEQSKATEFSINTVRQLFHYCAMH